MALNLWIPLDSILWKDVPMNTHHIKPFRSLQNGQGFSLLGVLAGVAGLGVLSLGLLEIAKMSSSISAMANENNEIQTQLYIGKILLSDQVTCTLNLQGIEVSDSRTLVDRILKQKGASGLGSEPIFSGSGANKVQRLYLRPVAGSSQIQMLDLEFSRNRIFGLDQALVRSIPLQVRMNGNRIVSCTAGDGFDPGRPDPDSGDPGVPALAKLGNCDGLPNPEAEMVPLPVNMGPQAREFEEGRSRLCEKLNYPISESGEVNCSDIFASGGANGNAFADRYGLHCGSPFTNSLRDKVKSLMLAGLASRESCMNLPMNPAGSTRRIRSRESMIHPAKDMTFTCINGRWVVAGE